VHTSTAPAPPPPESAPAPAEPTTGAEGVSEGMEAVQESQTSEAAEAGDQAKPAANENVEDGEAVGASDPVEAGLEDKELEDAEVDDQLSGGVPLEVRTVPAAEAAQPEDPLKDATSDITPTEVSFSSQT
jgi:hypothetical protein